MPALTLARMGHPILRAIAAPVADPTDAAIRALAADMAETMHAAAGVGLAAPQVFMGTRLIVFAVPEARQEPGEADRPDDITVLVNPELEPLEETVALGWEGCLSIPDLRGIVPRHAAIRYRGFDLDGRAIERTATGFHARVVQHEIDHLDGVLYLDRMRDMRLLSFTDQMDAFRLPGAEEREEP